MSAEGLNGVGDSAGNAFPLRFSVLEGTSPPLRFFSGLFKAQTFYDMTDRLWAAIFDLLLRMSNQFKEKSSGEKGRDIGPNWTLPSKYSLPRPPLPRLLPGIIFLIVNYHHIVSTLRTADASGGSGAAGGPGSAPPGATHHRSGAASSSGAPPSSQTASGHRISSSGGPPLPPPPLAIPPGSQDGDAGGDAVPATPAGIGRTGATAIKVGEPRPSRQADLWKSY